MICDKPMISVVTCCYNQGRFLADNIESVLKQNYVHVEHLVVDADSTDETAAVCARYPHIRYFHQKDEGLSTALNYLFKEAKGEIIAWLNSDDSYAPGAFAAIIAHLDQIRNRQIISGTANAVGCNGAFLWHMPNMEVSFSRLILHPWLFQWRGRCVMPHQPSVFFHRSLLDEAGPLDTSLKYAMDYDLWLRALRKGYRFITRPEVYSFYRFHYSSKSSQGFDTFLPEYDRVARQHLAALPVMRRLALRLRLPYFRLASAFHARGQTLADLVKGPPAIPPDRPPVFTHPPPRVTIITIACDHVDSLIETCGPVLSQSHANWEWLIMGVNGTTPCPELAGQLERSDPQGRIRLIPAVADMPFSRAATLNHAILAATGKYIAFLNPGDLWQSDKLELQVSHMETYPHLGLSFTKSTPAFGSTAGVFGSQPPTARIPTCSQLMLGVCRLPFSSILVRADVARETGGFEADPLSFVEDQLFLAKVAVGHALSLCGGTVALQRTCACNSRMPLLPQDEESLVLLGLQLRLLQWMATKGDQPRTAHELAREVLPVYLNWPLAVGTRTAGLWRRFLRQLRALASFDATASLSLLAQALINQVKAKVCRAADRYRNNDELRSASQSLAMKLAHYNVRSIMLYGAGRHTERFLKESDFTLLPVVGILDDFSASKDILGVPVFRPNACAIAPDTAVVISSDTSQTPLYKQACAMNLPNVRTLYN